MNNIYIEYLNVYGTIVSKDATNEQVAIDLPNGVRRWFYLDSISECTENEVHAFNARFNTSDVRSIFDALQKLNCTKEIIIAFRRGHSFRWEPI